MIFYANRINNYSNGLSYEEFIENSMIVDACVFNLSQIGELTANIDEQYEIEHPTIAWRQMYGLRNRIVHDYEGVNLKLVWEIIKEDIHNMIKELNGIKCC